MKVLFIASGNKGRMGHNFRNQYLSFKPLLLESQVYLIQGKGLMGYIKNVKPLRKLVREYMPDVIHAHYSLCGYLAAFSGCHKIIVSLMGSDCTKKSSIVMIRIFYKFFWRHIIVKSREMYNALSIKTRISTIPNGVDLSQFPCIDKNIACNKVGFSIGVFNIVFIGDPKRREKNVELALAAVKRLNNSIAELHIVYDVRHDEIVHYLRAADLLLLTSLHEGSPNVIKEAMACDLPVVATDVGDIRDNVSGLVNCHIVDYDTEQVAKAIESVMNNPARPNGRERLQLLNLTSGKVAEILLDLYRHVSEKKKAVR